MLRLELLQVWAAQGRRVSWENILPTEHKAIAKHNAAQRRSSRRKHHQCPAIIYTPRGAKPERGAATSLRLLLDCHYRQNDKQADNEEQGQNRANKQYRISAYLVRHRCLVGTAGCKDRDHVRTSHWAWSRFRRAPRHKDGNAHCWHARRCLASRSVGWR